MESSRDLLFFEYFSPNLMEERLLSFFNESGNKLFRSLKSSSYWVPYRLYSALVSIC